MKVRSGISLRARHQLAFPAQGNRFHLTTAIVIVDFQAAHFTKRCNGARSGRSRYSPLAWVPGFAEKNITDLIAFTTDQLTLPLGGLLIALFAGWVMRRSSTAEELALNPRVYSLWRWLIRYVVPVALLLVFVLGVAE